MTNQTRREFLEQSAKAVALGGSMPSLLAASQAFAAPGSTDENVLVIIQLSGGNDGLNTVIPCGDGVYYDMRPTLGVPEDEALEINSEIGLHPSLGPIKELYDEGKVAIVQGVGYPDPNRSHFRSMDIWHTAEPELVKKTGWLGKMVSQIDPGGDSPLTALNFGNTTAKAFQMNGVVVPSVRKVSEFGLFPRLKGTSLESARQAVGIFNQLCEQGSTNQSMAYIQDTGLKATDLAEKLKGLVGDYKPAAEYPAANKLAAQMLQVANLHVNGSGTRIYTVELGGFDSHSRQGISHPKLLDLLSGSVGAFYRDIQAQNKSANVMMMVFSEFGRRVKENGSQGTDHGKAGPMMVIGDRVKGGLYGEIHPSLSDLARGDLKFALDFRSVYATLIDRWMGLDPEQILGKDFERIDFV